MDSRIHSVVALSPPDPLGAALAEAMRADERVVLLGEAVGRQGGVLGASRGLLAAFGPWRVIDTPIAEEGLLGLAFGMALGGRRPVVELVGPSAGIWAQLARELGTVAARSRGEFSAPVVVRVPYGPLPGQSRAYDDDPAALLTLGALTGVSGLRVLCPSTAQDAVTALQEALAGAEPTVILEPRAPEAEGEALPMGRARVTAGRELSLVCWGGGVAAAKAAIASLAGRAQPELVDLRALRPLDEATLAASVRRCGRLVVVDDLHADGPSFAATAVVQAALRTAFLHLEAPPQIVPAEPGRIVGEVLASLSF